MFQLGTKLKQNPLTIIKKYDKMTNEATVGSLESIYNQEVLAMKLEPKEVMNAILNNDTGRAAEMLEGFDLLKDGTPPISLRRTSTSCRPCSAPPR